MDSNFSNQMLKGIYNGLKINTPAGVEPENTESEYFDVSNNIPHSLKSIKEDISKLNTTITDLNTNLTNIADSLSTIKGAFEPITLSGNTYASCLSAIATFTQYLDNLARL